MIWIRWNWVVNRIFKLGNINFNSRDNAFLLQRLPTCKYNQLVSSTFYWFINPLIVATDCVVDGWKVNHCWTIIYLFCWLFLKLPNPKVFRIKITEWQPSVPSLNTYHINIIEFIHHFFFCELHILNTELSRTVRLLIQII